MKYNRPYETQREFWITIYDIFSSNIDKFDLKRKNKYTDKIKIQTYT